MRHKFHIEYLLEKYYDNTLLLAYKVYWFFSIVIPLFALGMR
jgi:hypothetical protein